MAKFGLTASFYETYSLATAVDNMLRDRNEYMVLLSEFFCDGSHLDLIQPYQKQSALHQFISWVADGILYEETTGLDLELRQKQLIQYKNIPAALADLRSAVLPLEDALRHYGMKEPGFASYLKDSGKAFATADGDDLYDYFQELRLCGTIEELTDRMAREVFFVIFQNRQLLLRFNDLVSGYIEKTRVSEIEPELAALFSSDGRLRRVNPPKWVQRAVTYRERGHCAICHCELSGLMSVGDGVHFDHVIPLASGGLNDVTNIQLLCQICNTKKSSGQAITSNKYEPWYPDERDV